MDESALVTPRVYHDDNVNFFHDGLNTGFLGEFVQVRNKMLYRGRIFDAHFGCPESDSWLMIQTLLGEDPMRWKNCRWVSILVHTGGSVVVPDQFVEVIEPFKLNNDNKGMYFNDY